MAKRPDLSFATMGRGTSGALMAHQPGAAENEILIL